MKFAFTIQYHGDRFYGYQKQESGSTIQSELEKAFLIVARKEVPFFVAGRTDSGTNAFGQVIHIELDNINIDLHRFIHSMNAVLPHDISLIYGKQVPETFHARFSCLGREYIYQVLCTRYRQALYPNYLWIKENLDLEKIQSAIPSLLGEKDFAAFTRVFYQKQGESTIRRLDNIKIFVDNHCLYFYYKGSGFLHNMIRILTGTLIDLGKGKLSVQDVISILESKDRTLNGRTLPAPPLYFLNATYKDYETPKTILPFYGKFIK